jgi:hypothetical protein
VGFKPHTLYKGENIMREHEVNKLDNFICGFYLDNDELMDRIISEHKNSPNRSPGKCGIEGNIDIKTKDSTDTVLTSYPMLYMDYMNEMSRVVSAYKKKYPYVDYYGEWRITEDISVQEYIPPNQGFHAWHTERANTSLPQCHRHMVFMTYLNDVTDGGETEFYHQKIKIKPEKGLTLMWGSDWTFTHRGLPSQTQEKYVVTGWFSFV